MDMRNAPRRAGDGEEVLVALDGAGVRRNGRWLVEGIDLSVRPGEIVTLIGPNGSGKSTTAKLATGILKPDSGRVSRRPGLRIGYVPQKLALDATLPMTVGRLMQLTAPATRTEIDAALAEVGIPHLVAADIHHLSGGEFQRAMLARVLLRRPELLVLDEPVQGVDFTGEASLYELISAIRHRLQCGVLLISHDLHVVMAETDTVVCHNGHVCCSGPPQSVAASPEYLRLFGGRAAGALALYEHHHDHTHLPDGRVLEADGRMLEPQHDHNHHAGHHHG